MSILFLKKEEGKKEIIDFSDRLRYLHRPLLPNTHLFLLIADEFIFPSTFTPCYPIRNRNPRNSLDMTNNTIVVVIIIIASVCMYVKLLSPSFPPPSTKSVPTEAGVSPHFRVFFLAY